MDTAEIRQYAKLMQEQNLTALEVRPDGTVRLERTAEPRPTAPWPIPTLAGNRSPKPETWADDASGTVITSPMVGMFYIAPAENADPFVQRGSTVHKGDVLCIIEAMKLMNEITAESDGVISEILAVNGAVVEFGQPLFRIEKDVP